MSRPKFLFGPEKAHGSNGLDFGSGWASIGFSCQKGKLSPKFITLYSIPDQNLILLWFFQRNFPNPTDRINLRDERKSPLLSLCSSSMLAQIVVLISFRTFFFGLFMQLVESNQARNNSLISEAASERTQYVFPCLYYIYLRVWSRNYQSLII